jgi:hypothetical protein
LSQVQNNNNKPPSFQNHKCNTYYKIA